MASPASVAKHPIHPMLIPFPIALWIFSVVCDAIYVMGRGTDAWNDMAFYTMVGGIVGALAAAIPGYIDYRSVADPAVARIGRWHMLINLTIVALFVVNLLIRMTSPPGAGLPIVLSVIGIGLLGVSGWLGGELVYVHGVAVEPRETPATIAKEKGRVA